MKTDRMIRQLALLAGGGAVVAMATLTAGCGSSTKEEPSTTSPSTTATSTAPSASESVTLSPTEKALSPGGNNSFSPTVNPVPPNAVCKEIRGGVCVR